MLIRGHERADHTSASFRYPVRPASPNCVGRAVREALRLCDDLVEPWREEIRPQVIVVCDTGARLATLFSTAVGPRSHRIDAYKISGNLGGAFWYAICLCRFERGELDPYCGSEFRTRALRCAYIAHWRNGSHRSRFGLGGYSRRSRCVI